MFYQQILKDFGLLDDNIIGVYPYGSRIYQTHTESSDYDFIVVCKDVITESDRLDSKDNPISITLFSKESFQEKLNDHKMNVLEAFFCPKDLVLKHSSEFDFKINLSKLRHSISEKCSKDWNQAKKRFADSQGWNPITNQPYLRKVYEGKKSLFHCFRMIDFGMQIIENNKIVNFSSCNELWEEIYTNPSENWEDYHNLYHSSFNEKISNFRKVAPK